MARDDTFTPESFEFSRAKSEAQRLEEVCKNILSLDVQTDEFVKLNRNAVLTGLEAIKILGNAATHSRHTPTSEESVRNLNSDVMEAVLLADDAGLIQPPLSELLSPREAIQISRDAANHVSQVLMSTFYVQAEPIDYMQQI
ncbi:MAG: hypothetical protein Q7T41_02580 [Candidatus Saccharibacteria bacterium]|nr:hypothetical protein [Candidatus Saccharibacteria bacterium]